MLQILGYFGCLWLVAEIMSSDKWLSLVEAMENRNRYGDIQKKEALCSLRLHFHPASVCIDLHGSEVLLSSPLLSSRLLPVLLYQFRFVGHFNPIPPGMGGGRGGGLMSAPTLNSSQFQTI